MSSSVIADWGIASLLLLARLVPLVIWLPTGVSLGMTRTMRLGLLAVGIISLTPLVVTDVVYEMSSVAEVLATIARELLVGLTFAAGSSLLIASLSLGGTIISPLTGCSSSDAIDALSGEPSSAWESLLRWWSIAVIWSTNGHRVAVRALLDSFEQMPLGSPWTADQGTIPIVDLLAHGTSCGFRFAAPLLFGLLASQVTVAIVARVGNLSGASGWNQIVHGTLCLALMCLFCPTLSLVLQQQWGDGWTLVTHWWTAGPTTTGH